MSKKAKRIIALILMIIFGSILCVGTLAGIVDCILQSKLIKLAISQGAAEYTKPTFTKVDGNVTFTTDEDFKILQLTDIHICGGIFSYEEDQKAIKATAATVKAVQPDLVIVTGDINFAGFDNFNLSNKAVFKIFAQLMDTLKVYWTVSYGNHDSEAYNFTSRAKITKLLQQYEYCLVTDNVPEVYGEANQFINIQNSLGLITQSLVILDSGDYVKGSRKYDYVREDQIEWYTNGINAFSARNVATLSALDAATLSYPSESYTQVKSLAFFHIPLEEFRTVALAYKENGNADTDEIKHLYGEINEPVCNSPTANNLFEVMEELGSTKGIFVGHDHTNNAAFEYHGIRLCYSYSIDYYAYKKIDLTDAYRGGTIITVAPDGTFDSELYQLVGSQNI